jgi:hypothetical protein
VDTTRTTGLKRQAQMARRPLARCHDGIGELDWTEVLGPADLPQRRLRFIHDDRVPPGASIGPHRHLHDEEYYYILAGTGEMTLDGTAHRVAAGDVTAVFPGGCHGLVNTGTETMRVLVIGLDAAAAD